MTKIPDAKIIVEKQVAEALAKVRQTISNGLEIKFEETYEPPHESRVSYWGKAQLELIGAYAKDGKIAVLVWVKHWNFPERVKEEFWNRLCQRVHDELVKRIPDLKWFTLKAYFFDSLEDLEKAAFQGGEFPEGV